MRLHENSGTFGQPSSSSASLDYRQTGPEPGDHSVSGQTGADFPDNSVRVHNHQGARSNASSASLCDFQSKLENVEPGIKNNVSHNNCREGQGLVFFGPSPEDLEPVNPDYDEPDDDTRPAHEDLESVDLQSNFSNSISTRCLSDELDQVDDELSTQQDRCGGQCFWKLAECLSIVISVAMVVPFVAMLLLPLGQGQGPWPFGEIHRCHGHDSVQDNDALRLRQQTAQAVLVGLMFSLLGSVFLAITRWAGLITSRWFIKFASGISAFLSTVYVVLLPYTCVEGNMTSSYQFLCSFLVCLYCMTSAVIIMLTFRDRQPPQIDLEDALSESSRLLPRIGPRFYVLHNALSRRATMMI